MVASKDDERRIDKRVPFIQEVEIVGMGTRRCSDLSVGGMYLETIAPYTPGEALPLRLKLQESDPRPIEVQSRVLYVHPGIGVGLGFVDLKSEDRKRIEKMVYS